MKKYSFILLLWTTALTAFAQPQYDGALERFKMKSDKSVREGLIGEYYEGMDFERLVAVRQDQEIYFDWDYDSPIPELRPDYFSVRWRGKVYAKEEGKYVITAYTDDGMRVWLNGKIIINAWKDQPPTLYEARVILEADEFYDIRVDYYQERYQTTAAVFFNPEGEKRIPLNASNTVFGRDLEASNARFDFWDEEPLLDRFWTWMGFEEEKEERPFRDQSFRPVTEEISPQKPVRKEEQANKGSETTFEIKPVKSQNVHELEEIPLRKAETALNKYDDMIQGETLVMNNIYFDQGKARLRQESYEELDKLYEALERHPGWKIKIDGHTDNVGYAALNLELSYDRARAVYFYLIKRGIEKDRLSYEGFGSSRPLVNNDTEENKQQNRRVEVSLNQPAVISSH